jgi:hypothetical protein
MIRKRPLAITIICCIGFIGGLTAIPMAFSPQAQAIGHLYPLFLLLSAVIGLICFGGLWMMRRWSVIAYTSLAIVSQATLIALGTWSVTALVVPGLVTAICLFYYRSMGSSASQSAM